MSKDINSYNISALIDSKPNFKTDKKWNNYCTIRIKQNIGYGDKDFFQYFSCIIYPPHLLEKISLLKEWDKVLISNIQPKIIKNEGGLFTLLEASNDTTINFLHSKIDDNA